MAAAEDIAGSAAAVRLGLLLIARDIPRQLISAEPRHRISARSTRLQTMHRDFRNDRAAFFDIIDNDTGAIRANGERIIMRLAIDATSLLSRNETNALPLPGSMMTSSVTHDYFLSLTIPTRSPESSILHFPSCLAEACECHWLVNPVKKSDSSLLSSLKVIAHNQHLNGTGENGVAHMAAMDELVEHIVGTVSIDRGIAEKAVGIILDFLIREGPEGAVNELLTALPGAREAAAAAGAGGEETGGAGGLFGAMGGLMGAANRLMAAGLTMAQVQTVTREIVAFARKRLGEDTVGQIVGSIPGLGQIV